MTAWPARVGVVLEVPWYPKTLLIVADEATAQRFAGLARGVRGRIFTFAEVWALAGLRSHEGERWREDVRAAALAKIETDGVIPAEAIRADKGAK